MIASPVAALPSPSTPMLQDIRRQAATLPAILARRGEIADFASAHLAPAGNGRTTVFGSGDGWFAARAALAQGARVQARSGLDFVLNVAPRLTDDDRALAISMSGNVDRTLEGGQVALARGARLSILTNGAGGRLGKLGCPALSLDIVDIAPFLCGTSSYTATLAALQLAINDERFAPALAELVPHLEEFIEAADRFAQYCVVARGQRTGYRFLGVGTSVATADYGAAKFVEVTRTPAWSDDIEEFAHRQYWSMGVEEVVVLLPTDARSAAYADATADALSDLGMATIALEPEGAPVSSAAYRLALPGNDRTAALTQAIALQFLAYHAGIASGTDPNRREHLKNDSTRFAVSRKLTRRSLLGTGQ